jgi:AcrR family transcriptional regulator
MTWLPEQMTPSLGERKRLRTRATVADTALRLFAARGFDQVTVEEISEASDVSPRTFFRYFAAKEDTLFAESDAGRDVLLEALAAQPDDVPLLDALQAAMRAVAEYYADQRDRLRMRQEVVTSSLTLRSRTAERQQRWEGDIVSHVRSSGRAGDRDDFQLRLLVASTATSLRVAIETWIAAPASADSASAASSSGPELADLLETAFRRLCAGFSAG